MPEGHSVHRIARQFRVNFVGTSPEVSSPQGRFAQGAEMLTGRKMTDARAVGKQMFLEFDHEEWLRVHLGIYGAWDFAGDVAIDPSIQIHGQTPGHSRLGQTGEYSRPDGSAPVDRDGEDSVSSIGAPRKARVHHARIRMAERDTE